MQALERAARKLRNIALCVHIQHAPSTGPADDISMEASYLKVGSVVSTQCHDGNAHVYGHAMQIHSDA